MNMQIDTINGDKHHRRHHHHLEFQLCPVRELINFSVFLFFFYFGVFWIVSLPLSDAVLGALRRKNKLSNSNFQKPKLVPPLK